MATKTITVDRLEGWFTDAAGRIVDIDYGPTLVRARDWIAQDTAKGFQNSVSPQGVPLAPIHHRVGKPLVKSGLMYLSVIDQIDSGIISGNALTIRIDHPFYAIFHQFGTAHIKARPWLGITEDAKKRIYADAVTEILRQWIIGM